MRILLVAFAICIGFNRCSSDIDLTAPYQDITVIYGLLDQSRDIQFIKINKAFLGDEPLTDMAAVRDSIEYDEDQIISKRVEEWVGNVKTNEWELKDSLVEAINESIFYVSGITDPLRKVYYFEPESFNEDAEYKLIVDIEGKASVEGFTTLIPNSPGAITKPVSNEGTQTSQSINFASFNSSIDGSYPDYQFRWNAEQNARRYELLLEIRYVEHVWTDDTHTDLISSEEKVYSWDLGTALTNNSSGSDQLEKVVNGELFFLEFANNLVSDPAITREIGVLDESIAFNHFSVFNFVLTVGDEDLNSFLEFNEPVTSLAQERPQWTNVNNGQGLFSSRLLQKSINIKMSLNTIRELCTGQHTSTLNFCTKDLSYDDETFFCGE